MPDSKTTVSFHINRAIRDGEWPYKRPTRGRRTTVLIAASAARKPPDFIPSNIRIGEQAERSLEQWRKETTYLIHGYDCTK